MALDSSGNPHVLFSCWSQGLVHATLVADAWQLTPILDAPFAGHCVGLGVDSADSLHVLSEVDGSLAYLKSDGGPFTLVSSSEERPQNRNCSLGIGGGDEVIALVLPEVGGPQVLDLTNGWERYYAGGDERDGLSSIAWSDDGAWHFAYADGRFREAGILHATGVLGRRWETDTVDDARGAGPSLAIAAGEIHACYSVWREGDDAGPEEHLMHATRCLE